MNKLGDLKLLTEVTNPDMICITETWCHDDIGDQEISLPGYSLFRKDRGGGVRGGGVLLYVHENLKAVQHDTAVVVPESMWCSIQDCTGKKLYIGVLHNSRNSESISKGNDSIILNMLQEMLGSDLVLFGDFNYPDIDWNAVTSTSQVSHEFCQTLDDCFLT